MISLNESDISREAIEASRRRVAEANKMTPEQKAIMIETLSERIKAFNNNPLNVLGGKVSQPIATTAKRQQLLDTTK